MPIIRQINKCSSTCMKIGGKIHKMLLNSIGIYSTNLYHDKYIIKRHFTCTSANDDNLSTIKWDNLAWYSSDFNDFPVNNTSGCRIVIRSSSTTFHYVRAELSCIIHPSLPLLLLSISNFFIYDDFFMADRYWRYQR